jgi:predicted phosphodiesterase
MRIGLLADIHDDVLNLRRALRECARQRVDHVVVLGDTVTRSDPEPVAEVAGLLQDAGAIGVWGNHDFGLCHQVDEAIRRSWAPDVLKFMSTIRPRLELGPCHFSHVEPWLDPYDVLQLWYYEGPPDTPEKASRSFAAVPHRFLFLGHFHQWLLMTPNQMIPWRGERAVHLGDWERCLVIVAPVFDGCCAVFDTHRTELLPLQW